MIFKSQKWIIATAAVVFSLVSASALAVDIDNGFTTSQQGYWRVDVTDGGESRDASITGTGTPSGTIHENIEIVYDYFSYIDTGSGGFQLSATTVTSTAAISNPGEVSSAGNFMGAAGNVIDWVMVSSIEPGGLIMENELTLTARTGTLGVLDFYQYLDEDVLSPGDDVFFTLGNSGSDLELFTIDNTEALGVSHTGAQSGAQGLLDATFSGWAACEFDQMRPSISAGTQSVSAGGVMCADLAAVAINHPVVGASFGPIDVVSVVAWGVDPNATSSTIITTLGGVPDITGVIPGISSIPVPVLNRWTLALLTLLLGSVAMWVLYRRRQIV